MPSAAAIIWGLIFPGLLVAAVLLLAWGRWDGRWIGGPVVAAGFAVAFYNLWGPATFPPGNAAQWVMWFAIPVGILGALDAWLGPPMWVRGVLLLVLWRLAMRAILARLIPGTHSADAQELWIDAGSLVALVWWMTIENFAGRVAGMSTPMVLAILSLGVGLMIFTTLHIQKIGEFGISLSVICAGMAGAAWWNPRISLARGAGQAVVLLLLMLLVFAWFYTNDTLTMGQQTRAMLLLAAPLAGFLGDLRGVRNLRLTGRLWVRLAAVGLLVGALTGWSIADYVHAERASAQSAEE